ncbi:MAG: sulfite exporter TauE/SafE family protein [Phyllobacteriaceae bacterium]|nr:sulfite exporter TauE/SafE family protein [Phyllobacteriaceae bacterium]
MFGFVDPAYVASGLGVGLLVGMTGVGGGSLMTPLLVLLFGVHPVAAVGTDLLFAAVTKTVGMAVHGFNKTVDWTVTRWLATGSVPATIVTLWLLSRLQASTGGSSKLVAGVLGVMLVATAIALLLRRPLARLVERRGRFAIDERMGATATITLGALLGVVVSISSIGAGAIGMSALLLLHARRPIARLIGADIAHAVPLTLIAGIGHWLIGSVDFALLGALLIGSIPGVIAGSAIGPRLPEAVLRIGLAGVLAVVGAKLLVA